VSAPYRVLIADDEAPARARIRALVASCRQFGRAGEAESGPSTLAALQTLGPDLVFLDVQMPGFTGLEALRRLRPDERPVTVFTTAFEQYALDAFDASAIDYLLKPYTDERFHEALGRAELLLRGRDVDQWRRQLSVLLQGAQSPSDDAVIRERYLKRFAVRLGHRLTVVDVASVDWIEASGDYLELHAGRARHLVRMTMQEAEERLDPERFVRIHRSTMVQMDRVSGLEPSAAGDDVVVLRDGTRVRMSRRYRHLLRQRLGIE
jgi:two-component system, LytTR family, response regulator